MHCHPFGGGEEGFQFLVNNSLQIDNGDFVAAFLADIFRGTSRYIHPLTTRAYRQTGEKLYRFLAGSLGFFLVLFQYLVALIP